MKTAAIIALTAAPALAAEPGLHVRGAITALPAPNAPFGASLVLRDDARRLAAERPCGAGIAAVDAPRPGRRLFLIDAG